MKKIFFFTNLLFTLTAVPIFGQVGTPFSVTSTDTSICEGQSTTLSVQSLPGTITSLTCVSATNNGNLFAGTAASGVSSSIPYLGGNGGLHNGQTVASTGVTGLTATLLAGVFNNGSDSLVYTITGTPNTSGTANFALNIGGKTCILSRTVAAGMITGLTCASATNNGTLTAGVAASGVSSIVPYTGGNGGTHNGQIVTSTGVIGLTATLSAGTFVSGAGNLTYTITGTPSSIGTANFALNIGGKTCTLSRTVAAGTITSLVCSSATNIGTLTAGVAASSVSSVIPYTGGNGGIHSGQTVTSTGITGLTATLTAGSFANGAGSLSYIITGTPSTSGTASFVLNIGGQTCTLTRIVATLVSQYPTGSVFCTANPSAIVNVTNPTTGRIWMDRNLGATQVATSSTDANAYGDLYQWGRRSDGHQCRTSSTTSTLSSVDQPVHGNFITNSTNPIDWRSPQNNNLWQGLNGINNPCPIGYRIPTETEAIAEKTTWGGSTSANAFSSPLKFTSAGYRANTSGAALSNVGSWGFYWTSTINAGNSMTMTITFPIGTTTYSSYHAYGSSVRCIKEINGTIGALNCGSATLTGNLVAEVAASAASVSVPYTGGDGGYYESQSIGSTGVTGLTADISQGLFASGAGNLVYTISGTPNAGGTANFALNIGGKSCTLSIIVYGVQPTFPVGAVFCNGATLVSDVTNPTTGKTWMDRNLGATRSATSSTDANSFGDLYQWGRGVDGHQCRNSTIEVTSLAVSDQPGTTRFITNNTQTNTGDWRNPQNNNLWQGVNGINNPCPNGYRVPTSSEMDAERLSWSSNNSIGAFASTLKLPMAGDRLGSNGQLGDIGTAGVYWTSSISNTWSIYYSTYISFGISSASLNSIRRSNGYTVRCIKETIGSIGALNCGSSIVTGNLNAGVAASGVSVSVPYTGGNGGFYADQSVASTGVTGLTVDISQGLFASGAGNLVYTISGTPNSIGTASFALSIGGQSCILTTNVSAGTLSVLTCTSATNSGALVATIAASGVSSAVPYTGGDGGMHNGQTVVSTGVTGLTATLSPGSFAIGAGNLTYQITGTPTTNGTASFALNIGGKACTLTRTVAAGAITALTCSSATNNGTLTAGVEASGVSTVVPYTGGNGGTHNGQTVTSTGITGLTATLSAGAFAVGVGSVTYTITGTPTSAGTASFALNIGGRTCTLTRTVNCWSLNNTTTVVEVTNPTTGKKWMDRNLGAVRQATSSTDVFGYGDIYQWGRNADGHQCRNSLTTTTLSTTDQPATSNFIVVSTTTPGDWRNPQNNNLWQGVNGINNPCPSGFRVPTYAELNAEAASWTVANAYASVLKLPAGGGRLSVNPNNGNLVSIGVGGVYWTSTISGTNSRNISFGSLDQGLTQVSRSDGMSVRCIKETVGSIGALNCGSATVTGNLISGTAVSGVTASVPYTGGNGGYYAAQSISSTGVTGITASISQGLFASGAGNLVYTISGTPSADGTATFALNIGGQSCTLSIATLGSYYPSGSVFCASGPTVIKDVTNPSTGKTWMDRNLGASQVATSSTDANAYGDLYQWGRRSDGHQCRNSATTSTLSSTDQPGHGNFILGSSSAPFDWRSPQNQNLWQGLNGVNNPCPNGYRLPTETELNNERLSWSNINTVGAFASPLKITIAGYRVSGSFLFVGSWGRYWSSTSTITGNYSISLLFDSSSATMDAMDRVFGFSVRCIKD